MGIVSCHEQLCCTFLGWGATVPCSFHKCNISVFPAIASLGSILVSEPGSIVTVAITIVVSGRAMFQCVGETKQLQQVQEGSCVAWVACGSIVVCGSMCLEESLQSPSALYFHAASFNNNGSNEYFLCICVELGLKGVCAFIIGATTPCCVGMVSYYGVLADRWQSCVTTLGGDYITLKLDGLHVINDGPIALLACDQVANGMDECVGRVENSFIQGGSDLLRTNCKAAGASQKRDRVVLTNVINIYEDGVYYM